MHQVLPSTRLLTLAGAGGSGKTRLALEVARTVSGQYADGARLVELATIGDPTLVPQAVAASLGVREVPNQPLVATIISMIREQQVLVVFDTCEHVLDAAAQLSDALLRACPRLTIIATSREPLGVPGEAIRQVAALPFPPLDAPLPAAQRLAEYPAVQLFVDRARAFLPHFAITARNGAAVAEICQRLDGMPLALELAAALVRALSVDEIAARLDHRFRLLTGGSRAGLPRHQTLRATIDWSFELLNPAERAMFARLSVFVGRWDLEAAESICDGDNVLETLLRLIDKSLIVAEEDPDGRRHYRLLDTLREYGRERLLAEGQTETVLRRHADYVLFLAECAELHQTEWINRLAAQQGDLVSALEWYVEQGDVQAALRLAGVLGAFWQLRGQLADGRRRLTRLLALPGAQEPTLARARALDAAGLLALYQGDAAATRVFLKESLALYRRHAQLNEVAWVLINLAWLCVDHYRYKAARRLLREALPLCEQLGDRRALGRGLNVLGMVENCSGDLAIARALHEECLGLSRTVGDRWGTAWALANLGWDLMRVAFDGTAEDAAAAERALEDALEIWNELGERRHIAFAVMNLSVTSALLGKLELSRSRLTQATADFIEMHDRVGMSTAVMYWLNTLWQSGEIEAYVRLGGTIEASLLAHTHHASEFLAGVLEARVADCRERLGTPRFEALWAEGCALSLEAMMARLGGVASAA